MGLQFATLAYSTYVLPIISFVAQICPMPPEAVEVETNALRYKTPGPFRWCLPADLFNLDTLYGQARAFPSLVNMVQAAQIRVFHHENHQCGGLDIDWRALEFYSWRRQTEKYGRLDMWYSWLERNPVRVLAKNKETLDAKRLTTGVLYAQADQIGENPGNNRQVIQKGFQRSMRKVLDKLARPDAIMRMRHKLARWKLPGIERQNSTRCLKTLTRLKALVPPRVCAAWLRTLWNGWVTKRRFQQRNSQCVLGCGRGEGSIEHYAHCRIIRNFRATFAAAFE